jgi:hypothetical protein
MAQSVESLLDDIQLLGAEQREIVDAVRALVKSTIEPITEQVKYGGIMFSSNIEFCGVFAYKAHVSVEFGFGAQIDDSLGFLEGKGKGRRHLKLRSVDDIALKNLAWYLPLALQAAQHQSM